MLKKLVNISFSHWSGGGDITPFTSPSLYATGFLLLWDKHKGTRKSIKIKLSSIILCRNNDFRDKNYELYIKEDKK